MNLKQIGHCLIVSLGLLQFGNASAIALNFSPSNQIVDLNQAFTVDVILSDLNAAGEIVSTYDLDVTYDSSRAHCDQCSVWHRLRR